MTKNDFKQLVLSSTGNLGNLDIYGLHSWTTFQILKMTYVWQMEDMYREIDSIRKYAEKLLSCGHEWDWNATFFSDKQFYCCKYFETESVKKHVGFV